ncbi:MAG: GbsR/MarR family transcriptional regulator [Nocardioidaceae bacterium]
MNDDERASLVEEMGLAWQELGSPRMEGRVVGYLMLSNAEAVSTAELCEQLHASAGAISMTTRRLCDVGFIKRVAVRGERSHFFRAEEDVWGAFLAGERRYLLRRAELAEKALTTLSADDEMPRKRLANMRDYMLWLRGYHQRMRRDWEEYKKHKADGEDPGEPT